MGPQPHQKNLQSVHHHRHRVTITIRGKLSAPRKGNGSHHLSRTTYVLYNSYVYQKTNPLEPDSAIARIQAARPIRVIPSFDSDTLRLFALAGGVAWRQRYVGPSVNFAYNASSILYLQYSRPKLLYIVISTSLEKLFWSKILISSQNKSACLLTFLPFVVVVCICLDPKE